MHNFKQLTVWQKSIQLAINVYKFSQNLPIKDQYVFSSQLSRCAISIPSNIAEGAGKDSKKEFVRYLCISNGSSFELETQMIIIKGIYPERKIEIELFLKEVTDIQKMIFGLKKTINTKAK